MTKHTPTPWKPVAIKTSSERYVAQLCNYGYSAITLQHSDPTIGYANALFIVKAVNCHEQLVETLKAACEMFYTLGDKDTQESKDCFALYEQCSATLAAAEAQ